MTQAPRLSILALHFSLLLVACGPTPGSTPGTVLNPPTSVTPTPGSSLSPDSSRPLTPTDNPSSSPLIPIPSATPSNPAASTSTTLLLPDGSQLIISLANRFLETKGQSVQIKATLLDATGQPLSLDKLKLIYRSSRPQDLSVNDQGLVTAMVDQGFAEITVLIDGTELKASQLISVSALESVGSGGGNTESTGATHESLDVNVNFEGLGLGEYQVNTYTTDSQLEPAVAMDAEGNFVIAWQDQVQDGDREGIFAQRFSKQGIAIGSEFRVNTFSSGRQYGTDIAMDDDGDFVITWQSENQDGDGFGVFARLYDNIGLEQGPEFQVNSHTEGTQSGAAVSMDADGDFVVTWNSLGQDGDNFGVYAQRFNNMGEAQGPEFPINTTTTERQYGADVALDDDGDFVVSWQSYGQGGEYTDIFARRFDSQGNPVSSEFQVNTVTPNWQRFVAIDCDSDGDFVITWENMAGSSDISARRYNSSGVAQGNEFIVNTYTTGYTTLPDVAMDDQGNFVITYTNDDSTGDEDGVFAQRFNSQGIAQGAEFYMRNVTTSWQSYPAAAMDADGDFVVTWHSLYQDGNYLGIYTKRYDRLGQVQ